MTTSICVWYWLISLPYKCPFLKNSYWMIHIVDFVNKTRDKGKACVNEKRNRCNQIQSDRTLGRNDPSAGIVTNLL